MNVTVNMTGANDVIETMKELGKRDAGKALRSSLSYVAGKLMRRFRDSAPVGTGTLSQSFAHTERIYGQMGEVKSWIGVSTKFTRHNVLEKVEYNGKTRWRTAKFKKPIMYARAVETGSKKNAGWIKRVWDTEMSVVLASVKDDIWKKISAYAARSRKKKTAK